MLISNKLKLLSPFFYFVSFLSVFTAAGPAPDIQSEVWPAPASFTTGSISVSICDSFAISCASSICPDPLFDAFDRYMSIMFFAGSPATTFSSALCALQVYVDSDVQLSASANETYKLTVPSDGSPAILHAATQWGALRGIESFAQLVIWAGPDADEISYSVTCAPITIIDSPRFTHRGVLLDTSFNFLTVPRILEVLDSMAVMKANILHWHIVDDPAWPMVSSTFPSFTSPGGEGPYAQVATYSIDQQNLIADYAWKRGIMILVEFDVPGHSSAFAAGGSDLVIACDGHQTLINPVGEVGDGHSIYSVLAALIKEFYGRLGSPGLPWIHLGGDEVSDYTCWETSPAVASWAKSLNISNDPLSVRSAFTSRIQDIAEAAGLRALFWEETYNGNFGVRQNSIISPWVSTDVASKATAQGYDVFNYAGYYLDQWVPPARTQPEWYLANVSYAYVDSFRYLYAYDPEQGVSPTSPGKVLGGVACAWGDNVDSSLGAVALLYPRALAVGEKLWSPASFTRISNVQDDDDLLDSVAGRMEHARCRLAQRGIGASPVGVAGTYGFCWVPEWADTDSPKDSSVLSPLALFASLVAAALGGAVIVLSLFPAKRAAAAAWLSEPHPSTQTKTSNKSEGEAASRMVALDQLRGVTMVCMLFVNLYYGRAGPLAPFFSHGITYMSGPDLVEPAFHFCVGMSLRLVVTKRLAATSSKDWWASRWEIFKPLLTTRVTGLIILSMFVTEGWGQFDSWAELNGFGDWITQLVQNRQPYHTLLHIAFITVWTFLAMSVNWKWRAAQLIFSAFLHAFLHATFYFRWIADYTLDEGGYFGFIGWSIEALAGSLCYDAIIFARDEALLAATTEASEPLLREGHESSDERIDQSLLVETMKAPNFAGGLNRSESSKDSAAVFVRAASSAAKKIFIGAIAMMFLAYSLSCIGASGEGFLNPVCYDGQRIFFWGGFGAEVPCIGVPTIGNTRWLVAPPFVLPDPATNVITMWTMTQRAGSVTYHLFSAGTSAALLAFFLYVSEVGITAPSWWNIIGGGASKLLGVHLEDNRLRLRFHVAEVFGENALAIYLLGDKLGDQIGSMLPPDSPAWYFILWGEGLQLLIAYICAAYLRAHKLFLRL